MKKIYCFNNGGSAGMLHAVAMCEDGHVLAQHACSHEFYMRHDLGIVGDWQHEHYDAHCGKGNWELEWVDKPKKHPGLMDAFRLNQSLAQAHQDNPTTQTGESAGTDANAGHDSGGTAREISGSPRHGSEEQA